MTEPRQRMVAYALAAGIGGTGSGLALPMAWPGLYRDDPATGTELTKVQDELDAVKNIVREFMLVGPAAVRENQKLLLAEVSAIRRLFVSHEQLTRDYFLRSEKQHRHE